MTFSLLSFAKLVQVAPAFETKFSPAVSAGSLDTIQLAKSFSTVCRVLLSTYNTTEVKGGGVLPKSQNLGCRGKRQDLQVQGHPWQYRKFHGSLGYTRPCLEGREG